MTVWSTVAIEVTVFIIVTVTNPLEGFGATEVSEVDAVMGEEKAKGARRSGMRAVAKYIFAGCVQSLRKVAFFAGYVHSSRKVAHSADFAAVAQKARGKRVLYRRVPSQV